MNALIDVGNREVRIDLTQPVSLAIDLDFSVQQPRHFGAPQATSVPFAVPGFSGSVEHGASCNCQTVTLIPHCNGTHTECVGHLTREPVDAHRVAPLGFLPALLVSIQPVDAKASNETTEPAPQAGDQLITRHALEISWSTAEALFPSAPDTPLASAPDTPLRPTADTLSRPTSQTPSRVAAEALFAPRALVIRTLPNAPGKQHQDYSNSTPPYLSREAAELLVERGIDHLVVDLPSIDRAHDEGRLTAHRIFFGLPRGSTALTQATRAKSTVTELAYIANTVADGPYLLELQVPALGGDAVPSRPMLYRLSSLQDNQSVMDPNPPPARPTHSSTNTTAAS